MGYAKPRRDDAGKITSYTAVYRDESGKERSAGTYAKKDKKKAEAAWQDAEAEMRRGVWIDPAESRQLFATYVAKWFPKHQIELSTRRSYQYMLDGCILPKWGNWRMRAITAAAVREWITEMQAAGKPPAYIRQHKIIMSAIMSCAFNDDKIIPYNPCFRVKIPTVPEVDLIIITPEEFDDLFTEIFDPEMRLLVDLDIMTGLRWSELIELRPKDLDVPKRLIHIKRAAVDVGAELHPKGERFFVKKYPKTGKRRKLRITPELTQRLHEHITLNEIADDELIFQWRPEAYALLREKARIEKRQAEIDAAPTGRTEPNALGRQYTHGTTSAYNAGRCRCARCKHAIATYRAQRRDEGRDAKTVIKMVDRKCNVSGHVPSDWFRDNVWGPALKAAKLPSMRPYDMRHSHASWSLAGGADIAWVAERLGHTSIQTTRRYIHALDDIVDDTALNAAMNIRNRSKKAS